MPKTILPDQNQEPNYQNTNASWLTSEQVCDLLRISSRTLATYRQKHILPFSQVSRKIYYRAEDINEYLLKHYIKATYQKENAL